MSDHNHDNHGHDDHPQEGTKRPHAGYYEVPFALGGLLWALVLLIINLTCSGPCNGNCEGDKCCAGGEQCEKTEMHAPHH